MQKVRQTLIGDRAFYKNVAGIVVPVIIQNAITNFVSLLDNVMVGQVGTLQMSGVAIANQLFFVFYLCVFGGISGAGIFTAQYAGANDDEGIRYTFRFKILTVAALLALALTIFLGWGKNLVSLYLTDTSDPQAVADTLGYSLEYIHIILWGLLPYAVSCCYAGTLRETGETMLPMFASLAAVFTNLCGNYILIYGHLGLPALGVRGAAIATVASRFVELFILVFVTHRHKLRFRFIEGAWRSMAIPKNLSLAILRRGSPLIVNECLWSIGQAMLTQLYSVRGLSVVASFNISNTVADLFNVVFLSLGSATAIMIGQALGANEIDRAKREVWHLASLSVGCCLVMGGLLAAVSPFIPYIYNTTDEVRSLASVLLRISAIFMPFNAFTNVMYFTMRSGGKTVLTFLFDSGSTWCLCIPIAAALVYWTGVPVTIVYTAVLSTYILKGIIGLILIRKGVWIHNIVA